ncbi:hypothetical protein KEM55_003955 [Ascosphaera atra]|nr:hypothetical protein KEM55_003955 [Ascosphaera atra]
MSYLSYLGGPPNLPVEDADGLSFAVHIYRDGLTFDDDFDAPYLLTYPEWCVLETIPHELIGITLGNVHYNGGSMHALSSLFTSCMMLMVDKTQCSSRWQEAPNRQWRASDSNSAASVPATAAPTAGTDFVGHNS